MTIDSHFTHFLKNANISVLICFGPSAKATQGRLSLPRDVSTDSARGGSNGITFSISIIYTLSQIKVLLPIVNHCVKCPRVKKNIDMVACVNRLGRCHTNVCTAATGSQMLTATVYKPWHRRPI
jgi:hypothetical protein